MIRMILRGALAGLALSALLAVGDSVIARGRLFGLQTVIIGMLTGAIALLLALGMSLLSYFLAARGLQVALRQRLLAAAIFTGAAGLSCGMASVAVWLLAGRPFVP